MRRHPFDAVQLPLTGVQVIEASAGTGKTHSLIALFLRAVTERGLRAEQILLVTFTEAATADLRRRLDEALRRINTRGFDDPGEPYRGLLNQVRARVDNDDLVRARLHLAAQTVDRAAISTIHGFCARVLREQAFAAGLDLEAAEAGAQGPLWREATRDFWRAYTHGLAGDEVNVLRECFKTLEALARQLSAFASRVSPADDARVFANEVAREGERCRALASDLRERLRDESELDAAANTVAASKALSKDKRNGLAPPRVWAASKALKEWRDGTAVFLPAAARVLATNAIAEQMTATATKNGLSAPAHPIFDAIETLSQAQASYTRWRHAQFFLDATRGVAERVQRRQRALGTIGFDDLIERVAQALNGAHGARLAQALRRRYPLALIDEFQDTDARQYAIFRRLYFDQSETGLILIGDPKQAIYRFRGGDVYAYGAALRDAGGEAHTLGVNWRSEAGLVAAVNAVFARTAEPFGLAFVPFSPVEAAPVARDVLRDEACAASMIAWIDHEPPRSSGAFESRAIDLCADEIVRLLESGRAGTARIGDRPVRADDIAVLVRKNEQAQQFRAALQARGVRAGLVARGSVLETQAAAELETWLAAAEGADDPRRVRAAMAGLAIGADSAALAARDGAVLRDWARVFAQAAWRQRESGAIAAWWPVLQRLAPDLLARGGATHLAHWRHLLQWLDTHAPPGAEPGALRAWFARRRAMPDPEDREETLQASDDGARVRLLTIHRSKGLEFGIVFAPFLWQGAKEKIEAPFDYHDEEGAPRIQWREIDDDPAARQALREQLDEEVRHTYVAMTRAVHRLYVCFSPQKTARRSALARLVYGQSPADDFAKDFESLREPWTTLGDTIDVREARAEETRRRLAPEPEPTPRAARFTHDWPVPWGSFSFSSLHQQGERAASTADHDQAPATRLPTEAPRARNAAVDFGECFHAVMEDGIGQATDDAAWAALCTHHADRYALGVPEREELARYVAATRGVRLSGATRLDALAPDDFIVEMPFVFALSTDAARRAAAVLRGDAEHAHLAEVFEEAGARLHGQMRGYVDLIARADGRYFVLDYKTNRLRDEDGYSDAGMARAMREQSYDLQYLIYGVALHRYLRLRLGQRFDAARDLGGIVYLFVRGLEEGEGRGDYRRVPSPELLAALDAAFWTREAAA